MAGSPRLGAQDAGDHHPPRDQRPTRAAIAVAGNAIERADGLRISWLARD
jgi:hypothetical protein